MKTETALHRGEQSDGEQRTRRCEEGWGSQWGVRTGSKPQHGVTAGAGAAPGTPELPVMPFHLATSHLPVWVYVPAGTPVTYEK